MKEEVKPERKPDTDKTLKVITATIEGMKHWVRYKNTAPMIFQLVGTHTTVLDSISSIISRKFIPSSPIVLLTIHY